MCINIFRGTIPNQIGGLADLRFLQLDSNSLTGTIPSQLGQLDMLIFMSAADLQLNGIMPSQVCVNRGEPNNPDNGNLAVLIVDCDPADQKVGDYLLGPLQFTSFYVNQYMHNRYSVNAAPIVVFKSKVQLFHNSPRSGLRSKEMNLHPIHSDEAFSIILIHLCYTFCKARHLQYCSALIEID